MRITRKFIPWIVFHLFEFWYFYIFALISLFILHSAQVQIPELAKSLGDNILSKNFDKSIISTLLLLSITILVFRTLSRWLFFLPARVQQKNLRIELLELIRNSYPSQYSEYNFGQIYQIVLNDLNRLRGFIGFALLQIGNIIIAAWVLVPKIFEIDSRLFIAFSPMVASVILFSVIIFFFQPFLEKAVGTQGEVQNILIETFDAKGSIANFQKEKSFFRNFKIASNKELSYFFKASIGPSMATPLVPLGMSFSLLWGAWLIFKLELGVTTIILFSGLLYIALEPLMFLSWIGVVTMTALVSWKRIKKFVGSLTKKMTIDGSVDEIEGKYKFKTLLWEQDIELNFEKNQAVGICGKTASGKSHLLFSIADLLKSKNKSFSLVLQEPHLFNDSIRNNLILGRENITDDMILELIEIFSLDQLEQREENILDLIVGENGKKLSGGQIKRMALIQSLLSDEDVYLWDDPFSSVDNILEKEILDKLNQKGYFKNKLLIFTSHRVTTFQIAQEIYFIKDKKITKHNNLDSKELSEFFQSQRG